MRISLLDSYKRGFGGWTETSAVRRGFAPSAFIPTGKQSGWTKAQPYGEAASSAMSYFYNHRERSYTVPPAQPMLAE